MPTTPTFIAPDCITVESQGGIGNQLFIYAYARAIQIQSGLPVAIDTWRHNFPGARPFQIAPVVTGNVAVFDSGKHRISVLARVQSRIPWWGQRPRHRRDEARPHVRERSMRFDPFLLQIQPGAKVTGYFQSWKYFELVADQLRTEILAEREKLLPELGQRGPSPGIALHVRLGDYLHFRHRRTHDTVPESYYRTALGIQLRASIDNVVTVFSDEPQVAIRMMEELETGAHFQPSQPSQSDLHELLMMSSYKQIVCANSTFSWWAAWLGGLSGDSVTVPRMWINRRDFCTSDLIPIDWTVLP